MKKVFLLLTIIGLISSCKVNEKPEFLRVENIQVINATLDTLVVSADAFFNNPNDIGGTLETKGIEVIVNAVSMANVSTKAFKVPANQVFSIPLTASVPTKDVFEKNKDGLIGGLITSLLTKKIKVQYKGDITYKALGLSYDYPIDITQDVPLE